MELPQILGGILEKTLDAQPDMKVVGNIDGRRSLAEAAVDRRADVVVIGLEAAELPVVCQELVVTHPQIKVLAVAGDGLGTFLYELRPQTSPLGEVSPQGLVDAIRAATASSLRP